MPKREQPEDKIRRLASEAVLATRIKDRMEALGLNPLSAAKKAGLGDDFVRDILRGKVRKPSAERLARLAEALECSLAYLLGEPEPAPGHMSDWSGEPVPQPLLPKRPWWAENEIHTDQPSGWLPIKFELSRSFRRPQEVRRLLGQEAASIPAAYANRPAWLEVVRDDHADPIAAAGALLVVSELTDQDRPSLQDGDVVIVERHLIGEQASFYWIERTLRIIRNRYPSLGMWFLEHPAPFDDEDEGDMFSHTVEPLTPAQISEQAAFMADAAAKIALDHRKHEIDTDRIKANFVQLQKMRPRISGRVLRVITPIDPRADFGLTAAKIRD